MRQAHSPKQSDRRSRAGAALALASVLLLAGGAAVAHAQQDLDAGKSPAQLFSSNCTACHRSPAGLARNNSAQAVSSFLTQHYTTGKGTATALGAYIASVGGGGGAGRVAGRQPATATPLTVNPSAVVPGPEAERLSRREQRKLERKKAAEARRRAQEDEEPASRGPQGPATVSSDPAAIIITAEPVPVPQEPARATEREPTPQPASTQAKPSQPEPAARPQSPIVRSEPPAVGAIVAAAGAAVAGLRVPNGEPARTESPAATPEAGTPGPGAAEAASPEAVPAKPDRIQPFSAPLP